MTELVTIDARELEQLRALAAMANRVRLYTSIKMAGVGEGIMVLKDEQPVGIEQIVLVNKVSVKTDTGKVFSRRKGLMSGAFDGTDMRAVPIEGFPYARAEAVPNCQKMNPAAANKGAPVPSPKLRHYLKTRDHYWFDAVFVDADWYKNTPDNPRKQAVILNAHYEVLTGPMKGFVQRLTIPYILRGAHQKVDSALVEKMFDAEEVDFDAEKNHISPEFFLEHLGDRPVQIHAEFRGTRNWMNIDDVRAVTDNWIEAVIGWTVDPETGIATDPEAE